MNRPTGQLGLVLISGHTLTLSAPSLRIDQPLSVALASRSRMSHDRPIFPRRHRSPQPNTHKALHIGLPAKRPAPPSSATSRPPDIMSNMRSINEPVAVWVEGWVVELWRGRSWDPFSPAGEPEVLRFDTTEAMRKVVRQARADREVTRYECSPGTWEELRCTRGHRLQESTVDELCPCGNPHQLYDCAPCSAAYSLPKLGQECAGPRAIRRPRFLSLEAAAGHNGT
jgi:hypothetical protein